MATTARLPACLLSSVPVLHPPHLEGDPSLATEILPGPPSLASVRLPPKKLDPKKPVPPVSYLPLSDPGTTFSGIGIAGTLATVDGSGSRRKRARMDKGPSNRAQRASARGIASIAPPPPPELNDTLPPQLFPGSEPATFVLDEDITLLSSTSTMENNGEGPSKVSNGRGRRKATNNTVADKDKENEHENPHIRVKEEPQADLPPIASTWAQRNEDHCSSCSSLGSLIYCDGCPRAFHLWCLDPPMEAADLAEGEDRWYCPKCKATQKPPSRPTPSFLSPLIQQLQVSNPVEFQLPEDIRTCFRNVATGPRGAYVDSSTLKPPRLGRSGLGEEREHYRLKDNKGTILCFQCGRSALPEPAAASSSTASTSSTLPSKRPRRAATVANAYITSMITPPAEQWKTIVSCDYCSLHWHLDCLDPPLSSLPPAGRKWKCPNHASNVAPKRRMPKQSAPPLDITGPKQSNNGNIEIINSASHSANAEKVLVDEVLINGRRYRVPERVIVLDFWSKVRQARNSWHRQTEPTPVTRSNSSSPLTSISSLPDVDSPPPPSSITSVPCPSKKDDADDIRKVAELLCSMQSLPMPGPVRTVGNYRGQLGTNKSTRDAGTQTESKTPVRLEKEKERISQAMKPATKDQEIAPMIITEADPVESSAKKRQLKKGTATSLSTPTAKPATNGKAPSRSTRVARSPSPPREMPNTKSVAKAPQTSLIQHSRNVAVTSTPTNAAASTSTGNDIEKTPNNQSHSLKIRIPGLNSLNKSSTSNKGGVAVAASSTQRPSSTSSSTATTSKAPAASSLGPRRSLRRRLSSHSGHSNGSSLTSMTSSSNQSLSMDVSDDPS